MAKTLLNAINEILKRVNQVAGDAAALTSLSDSARQHMIDISVQVINEGMDDLYLATGIPKPLGQGESTIVLATGTRAYALAAGLVRLRFPLIDKTNTQFILAFPGDYNAMLQIDPEQDNTGLPHYGAISPVTGYVHFDAAPTSVENGKIYTYQFDKDIAMSSATDTVPFSDAAFRAMVPVWVQLYKREMRNEFDTELYRKYQGLAAGLVSKVPPRESYSPR